MTQDAREPTESAGEEPTVVVTKEPAAAAKSGESLWSRDHASGAAEPSSESADPPTSGTDDDAVREVADAVQGLADSAKDRASDAKERAGALASDAKVRAGAAAGDAKDRAGAFAGAGRERAAAFAASARERAASTDVKELAASTTSLIDTARPFFLAAFAAVFTLLAFIEDDHGTSQIFAVGAIIFVLAAAFSDELGHLLPRARREGEE